MSVDWNDPTAIDLLVRLDPETWRDFYSNMVGFVAGIVVRNVPSREVSEVTSEVLLKIAISIQSFRREAHIKTWIHRVATNTCSDWRRRSLFARLSSYRVSDALIDEGIAKETRESCVRDVVDALGVLNRLSEEERNVFILVHYEDLSEERVAEKTGLTRDRVRSRKASAEKKLEEWRQADAKGPEGDNNQRVYSLVFLSAGSLRKLGFGVWTLALMVLFPLIALIVLILSLRQCNLSTPSSSARSVDSGMSSPIADTERMPSILGEDVLVFRNVGDATDDAIHGTQTDDTRQSSEEDRSRIQWLALNDKATRTTARLDIVFAQWFEAAADGLKIESIDNNRAEAIVSGQRHTYLDSFYSHAGGQTKRSEPMKIHCSMVREQRFVIMECDMGKALLSDDFHPHPSRLLGWATRFASDVREQTVTAIVIGKVVAGGILGVSWSGIRKQMALEAGSVVWVGTGAPPAVVSAFQMRPQPLVAFDIADIVRRVCAHARLNLCSYPVGIATQNDDTRDPLHRKLSLRIEPTSGHWSGKVHVTWQPKLTDPGQAWIPTRRVCDAEQCEYELGDLSWRSSVDVTLESSNMLLLWSDVEGVIPPIDFQTFAGP